MAKLINYMLFDDFTVYMQNIEQHIKQYDPSAKIRTDMASDGIL